jgi:hypothetical protein
MWVSRHSPTDSQRRELSRIFGPHDLRIDPAPFSDALDIKRRMMAARAQEIVCVAPLSVLKELLTFGIRPLTADMEKCKPDEAEVETTSPSGSRFLRFVRFRRLTEIVMTYEDVTPCRSKTT